MMEGLKEALQYITGLKEKSMEPKLVPKECGGAIAWQDDQNKE